ncbi:hypothetical protein F3Y22_tig00110776pilonHSYRG00060 [Hibiscus syriacus]|uniref:Uncharacterized protein n=2 Tax=Hibiscus syriacus TaxID=106335 RepID=A0A6A2ZS57_HIBSY|nr:hypothetical protein F3Y22_tig00110776pilonHSYRG00060 [Hibiscus syriacus]
MGTGNKALVGQRIKVWSTYDNCFYTGTVDDFNPVNNTHKIMCDSGEVDILCLDSESWETISDCSLTDREIQPSDKPNALHLRQCVKETAVKLINDSRQQSKTKLNMEDSKVHCREKRKKEERSSRNSSVSEVINIDEDRVARTRRRKA